MVSHARKMGGMIGEHYLEVRFEDLVRDPASVLGCVCDFLGEEYDPSSCEYTGDVDYELYFEDDAQLETWLEERRRRRSEAARKAWRRRKGAR